MFNNYCKEGVNHFLPQVNNKFKINVTNNNGFKLKTNYELIIGSSNLTQDALSKNIEYNLKLSGANDSKLITDTLSIFNKYFQNGH